MSKFEFLASVYNSEKVLLRDTLLFPSLKFIFESKNEFMRNKEHGTKLKKLSITEEEKLLETVRSFSVLYGKSHKD